MSPDAKKAASRTRLLCLVEDDPIMGESLADRFALEGIEARWFQSAEEAEPALLAEPFAAVACDIRLPQLAGDRLFERLRATRPVLPPFIFITGFGDLGRAVDLLKLGAADDITKPFDLDRLIARAKDLLDAARADDGELNDRRRRISGSAAPAASAPATEQPETARGAGRAPDSEDAQSLGPSTAMARVEQLPARIAPLDTTVLMRGETGCGQEVIARRLHRLSGRSPFVAVNCAALGRQGLHPATGRCSAGRCRAYPRRRPGGLRAQLHREPPGRQREPRQRHRRGTRHQPQIPMGADDATWDSEAGLILEAIAGDCHARSHRIFVCAQHQLAGMLRWSLVASMRRSMWSMSRA